MFWYFLYEKPSNGRERSNNIRQRYKLFNRLIFDQKKKRKKEKKKKKKKKALTPPPRGLSSEIRKRVSYIL